MSALSPLARTFVDQSVQSAALQQKHRTQIWAKLQQRVSVEASSESPRHAPSASLQRFTFSGRIGWAGFFVATGAILASVFGTVIGRDHASEVTAVALCPPIPNGTREASLAPTAPADSSTLAMPSDAALTSKQAPASNPPPKVRQLSPNVRGNGPRARSGPTPIPPSRVATLLPHRDLQTVVVERSAGAINADSGYALTHTATHRNGAQFGVSPEWLEFAPHLVGGFSPLGEGQFESSLPLKLTHPQLRLTATLLE